MEYTKVEFAKFKKLVEMAESQDQMDRIRSGLDMPKFVETTGKEKCDYMFIELCKEEY